MPVGTPLPARPEGTERTGQRLMVLNGVVMHQARIGHTSSFLPLIFTSCSVGSKSARAAGKAVVAQISSLYFSRIGPSVAYIFVAISMERRKTVAVDFDPCFAKSTA